MRTRGRNSTPSAGPSSSGRGTSGCEQRLAQRLVERVDRAIADRRGALLLAVDDHVDRRVGLGLAVAMAVDRDPIALQLEPLLPHRPALPPYRQEIYLYYKGE